MDGQLGFPAEDSAGHILDEVVQCAVREGTVGDDADVLGMVGDEPRFTDGFAGGRRFVKYVSQSRPAPNARDVFLFEGQQHACVSSPVPVVHSGRTERPRTL